MKTSNISGSCLCGGVTVSLPSPARDVGVCHCGTCRSWGSGPWMALQAPGAVIDGGCLKVYKSSSFAERGFCARCGTHIFHRPRLGSELAVSAGIFKATDFYVAREIFIDAKPPFYRFKADSMKTTRARMILEWFPKLAFRAVHSISGRKV